MVSSVLIVDDDPTQLDLFRTLLKPLPCNVFTAEDGKETLALLHQTRPELLILDMFLPGTNGLELARTIRAEGSLPKLRIFLITAGTLSLTPDDEPLLDEVLSKPSDVLRLKQMVRQVLQT